MAFDYYTDTVLPGYGNEDLMTQDAKLRLREEELKEQARRAAQAIGVQPQGQMIGNIYVPPSKSQMLLPLAQQIATQVQQKKLAEDRSGFRAMESQAVNAHLSNMPAEDAPIQAKLAWAQKGATIPSIRPQMQAYVTDLLVKEPDRIAALQDRKDARADRATEAEKQRQWREAEAQRQRDFQGQQNDANRSLRETIASAMASRSGGEKAGDYQVFQGADGTLTRVNKLTGESAVIGGGGKPSAAFEKQEAEAKTSRNNYALAFSTLNDLEKLIPKATSSGIGAWVDSKAALIGKSSPGADAAAETENLAKRLFSLADRGGLGPQFSDADRKFLEQQMGDLGNPATPQSQKMAKLKRVRELFKQRQAMLAAESAPRSTGNLRQDIVNAAKSLDSGLAGGGETDTQNLMLQEYRKADNDADRAAIKRELDRAGYKGPLPGSASVNATQKRSIDDLVNQYAPR